MDIHELFAKQAELMRRLDVPSLTGLYDLRKPNDTAELMLWINKSGEKIVHEGCEVKDWTPWKHWSEQIGSKDPAWPKERIGTPEHIHEIFVECVDVMHFVAELSIILGRGPDDFLEQYAKKNKINHNRQDSGRY